MPSGKHAAKSPTPTACTPIPKPAAEEVFVSVMRSSFKGEQNVVPTQTMSPARREKEKLMKRLKADKERVHTTPIMSNYEFSFTPIPADWKSPDRARNQDIRPALNLKFQETSTSRASFQPTKADDFPTRKRSPTRLSTNVLPFTATSESRLQFVDHHITKVPERKGGFDRTLQHIKFTEVSTSQSSYISPEQMLEEFKAKHAAAATKKNKA